MTARQRRLQTAPTRRPAETTGLGGGVAAAIAYLLGAPVELVAALGVLAGALPAVVTYLVTHGGIRGIASLVWRGRTTPPQD